MKSWKTTIAGLIGAVATALIPVLKTGTFTLDDLILPAAIAVLGFLSKDFNVSNSTDSK